MQTLLNFIIKHNHWFLFLLLEGAGVMLVVQFNSYQNATIFTSANRAVGNIFSIISDVNGYFALKSENERLLQHNRELLEQVGVLNEKLAQTGDSATIAALGQGTDGRGFIYNTAVSGPVKAICGPQGQNGGVCTLPHSRGFSFRIEVCVHFL